MTLLATMLMAKAAAQSPAPSLWVTDDATATVYNIDLEGNLLDAFETLVAVGGGTPFLDSPSEIAIDYSDDTLWVVFERPPRLANYSKQGVQIGDVVSLDGIANGPEGVEVAIDPLENTLWVVDDPEPDSPAVPSIYRITKDGTLIAGSLFPTSTFDADATSPQGIALDPFDGSLWLTDNNTDLIYNIDSAGALLGRFHSPFAPGNVDCQGKPISAFNTNPQGIAVDYNNGTLWVTDRTAQRVYNITVSGEVLASFCGVLYDPNALNPSGVSFDIGRFIELGAAAGLTALALDEAKLKLDNGALIDGDVGVGPDGEQDFEDSVITGRVLLDPRLERRDAENMLIGAGTLEIGLRQAAIDARRLAAAAGALTPTRSFGEIKQSLAIDGGVGLNVVAVDKIELQGEEVLTLRADAGAEFVINVYGKLKLEDGAAVVLQGGLRPERVLFNVVDEDVEIRERSRAAGVYLSNKKVKLEKSSVVRGSLIAGETLEIKDAAELLSFE